MKDQHFNLFNKQTIIKFFTLLSLVFAYSGAQANNWRSNQNNSVVKVEIIDDNGNTLNQYSANTSHYKTNRTYLEAIKGKRYKLQLRNTSNRRVGVVVAVDGRNILTGKKSYLGSNEKMYVLDPYETANYAGWRTSKNHVSRFYFTSAGDSYSSAWGDRSAMGVIAVATFKEKIKRYGNRKYKQSPSHRGYLADKSTGTGFGRESYSPTINVNFIARHNPVSKHFIKYEWRTTLCKRGIVDCNNYYNDNHRSNNRFWPREANNGYAPYPPKYQKKRQWADQFITGWDTQYERGW